MGARIRFRDAARFQLHADADLSRDSISPSRRRAPCARRLDASYDHVHIATEGPVGPRGARLLPARSPLLHHELPHALPRIYSRARRACRRSRHTPCCAGFTTPAPATMVSTQSLVARTARARLHADVALVARRRSHDCSTRPPRSRSTFRGRSFFTRAGSRSRKTSTPSCRSICRERSSSPATARRARRSRRDIRTRAFSASRRRANSRLFTPVATCSSFRAAPTLSAWCCWRRWPAALPVAAFPTPGPLDVVGASGAGVLDEDLRAAALKALTIDREIARAHALTFTWENSARQFLDNINVARGAPLLGEKPSPGEQNAAGLRKMGLPI